MIFIKRKIIRNKIEKFCEIFHKTNCGIDHNQRSKLAYQELVNRSYEFEKEREIDRKQEAKEEEEVEEEVEEEEEEEDRLVRANEGDVTVPVRSAIANFNDGANVSDDRRYIISGV
ncbi:hypothetical protein HZH68_015091 [Vespula germanica]|uniref:Uncharacterized protein n=1 Tax=Vespula germanica TaxID=30212 RepID=A0A834J888_VESGE|nr:hypothetical protein HZH68_015091 [Vespula germanica]